MQISAPCRFSRLARTLGTIRYGTRELTCEWSEIQQQLLTPNIVFSIFHWPFEAKFMLIKYWQLLFWSGWRGPPRGTKTKIWAHESGCTHCDVTWRGRRCVSPCFFFIDVLNFRVFFVSFFISLFKMSDSDISEISSYRSSGRECSDSETDEYCGVVCR